MYEDRNNNINSGGYSGTTVLTIVFVVLKLTKTIAWSWWWVLSPLWISFTLGAIIFGGYIIGRIIYDKIHDYSYSRERKTSKGFTILLTVAMALIILSIMLLV